MYELVMSNLINEFIFYSRICAPQQDLNSIQVMCIIRLQTVIALIVYTVSSLHAPPTSHFPSHFPKTHPHTY